MASPTPLEDQLLAPVLRELDIAAGQEHAERLEVLEAVSAAVSGCSLQALRDTDAERRALSIAEAQRAAAPVLSELTRVPIPPALALTALARPPMERSAQRKAGAYYTDFRLAQFLAQRMLRPHQAGRRIIDAASGTGILLVAACLASCSTPEERTAFVGEAVHAADLDPLALRGTKLALASLTADNKAIAAMATRLRMADSLVAGPSLWSNVAPNGFQTVIGNPPWEKLKLSRHEHLSAMGVERHYGSDYEDHDALEFAFARTRMNAYASELSKMYELEGGGDTDLYKLFLNLAVHLAAEDGQVALLVPAGLIRSQGTQPLREFLLKHSSELDLTVLDNKARFFAIDTRFKFLALRADLDRSDSSRAALVVEHARGTEEGVEVTGTAQLGRSQLRRLRPDLTVPEVRSTAEWRLFRKMSESGVRLGDAADAWPMDIVREVDMTNDRKLFVEPSDGALPLIEGRMVHQFRSTHKAYVSGSGRRAVWRVTDLGRGELVPQFWVAKDRLSATLVERAGVERVGFCDITGQTNERAMLAGRIPAGAICGNKVPTITFAEHPNPAAAADLWLAIVNSFAFDWLLRRLMTTTVNYFLLRGIPFPQLTHTSTDGQRLIQLARLVDAGYRDADSSGGPHQLAEWRAEMDALVMRAYGLEPADGGLLLRDFPLLDRGQVPLPGEARSTITRDLVLDTFSRLSGAHEPQAEKRLADALLLGAVAYVPTELAKARTKSAVIS